MTLEALIVTAQLRYMDWYHRPGYWPTADGVVPYRLFVETMKGVGMVDAQTQLTIAGGTALAQVQDAGHTADSMRRKAEGR